MKVDNSSAEFYPLLVGFKNSYLNVENEEHDETHNSSTFHKYTWLKIGRFNNPVDYPNIFKIIDFRRESDRFLRKSQLVN